jgi:hypothetical protein
MQITSDNTKYLESNMLCTKKPFKAKSFAKLNAETRKMRSRTTFECSQVIYSERLSIGMKLGLAYLPDSS